MSEPRRRPGTSDSGEPPPLVWGFVRAIVGLILAVTMGWFAAGAVFTFTGRPPELVAYLISMLLGFVLAWLGAWLFALIGRRRPGNSERIGDDILNALDRISRGDFTARVTPARGMLSEVAESVNKMAEELGGVEQHRQEFISNVSHEIQSPLTSIAGFTELLRSGDMDEATRTHYLDIISSEAQRLSKLSDNLLRLSVLENGDELNRQAFRLDEQVRSVALTLEPQWAAKHIQVELATVPVTIGADEEMLYQVWLNLIHNATKYTPSDGRIRVAMERAEDTCTVKVSDTGIGIDEADERRVFERFFRADKARSGEGAGLGLSLVKRVVDLHGGVVTVTSEPGVGSTFTVTLPCHTG